MQAVPKLHDTVTVNVTGESICCLNTMDHLVGTIRDVVLAAVKVRRACIILPSSS